MLYLRLSIGLICIILCSKIGKNKGNKYKNAYTFYKSCLSFCNGFKSDLLYKKSTLADFLKVDYPSVDFKNMLEEYLTNQAITDCPDFLNLEEKLEIENFLTSLGRSDSASQMQTIDAFKEKFLSKVAEKKAEYKKYYVLSTKLGFVVGLGLMIMVI